jgi:hypothetical protein
MKDEGGSKSGKQFAFLSSSRVAVPLMFEAFL